MSVITVQYYELFAVMVSCILVQYEFFLGNCSAGAGSGVSLVTVSCDVICSGDVSCDGTI